MNNLNCFANSLNFGLLPKGLLTLFITILCGVPLPCTAADDLTIYNDAIANSWEDWSWDGVTSSPNTAIKKVGINSLAVKYSAAWQGLSYHHIGTAVNSKNYTAIHFWVYGSSGSGLLQVVIQDKTTSPESTPFYFTPTANKWAQITVPLSKLGNPATIARLSIKDATGTTQPVFYIDDLRFVAKNVPLAMTVDAANRKPISPYIYGMNYYSDAAKSEVMLNYISLPVRRWGGNDTSRYNWEIDATNTGSDSYFVNTDRSDSNNPPKLSAVNDMIDINNTLKADTLLTVPMIGFVAKDQKSCGFSITKYGTQYKTDPDRPGCGDGIIKIVNNSPIYIKGNSPSDTSTKFSANSVKKWVAFLTENYSKASQGGVKFYGLDNEPEGWHETHRDVFPIAIKYDQLRDRTYQYAAAIKSVDPSAKVFGPVINDWSAYWNSPYDLQREDWATPDDTNAHGGIALIPWYLQQMKAYEKNKGKRILDYLDLHYYPQCGNGKNCSIIPKRPDDTTKFKENPTIRVLRLRSTRSLWDPTYVDESWRRDVAGGIVNLIPRMKAWVKDNYPGTKIAISEYTWGALWDMSGALAQADVLGLFGREGLDLATLWWPPIKDEPGDFAFRMYRNYNGKGGKFGSTGVSSKSTHQDQLAIYAAQETSTNALTLIVINKTAGTLSAPVALQNFKPSGVIEIWRYSDANKKTIVHPNNSKFKGVQFSTSFPANSITLLRIPKS
jgi:hypothetical protein